MARRQHLTVTVALALVVFFFFTYMFSGPSGAASTMQYAQNDQPAVPLKQAPPDSRSEFAIDMDSLPTSLLEGESIAPKLENKTLKYVLKLYQSRWHVSNGFHTK